MNVKSWLYSKLILNSALMTAIGGSTHLVQIYPNSFGTLPILVYNETMHRQGYYVDDTSTAIDTEFTFDIYANTTTSAIADLLTAAMSTYFFNLDFSADLYEIDAKIFHRVCRYKRMFRLEELT